MRTTVLQAAAMILTMTLAGCTNNFAKFYTGSKAEEVLAHKNELVLSGDPPTVIRGTSPAADDLRMFQEGYVKIGYSTFNAGRVNEKDAVTHGEDIHAAVVILYSAYTHTHSGAVPLTVPNTQTSTTQISGTTFGQGGIGNYSGTANTTTYGSRTTMMPYNVDRYDYGATYWVKAKPMRFGAKVEDLSQEQRKQIGSNKGVQVVVVGNGTPAFHADIFRGDIIRQIGEYSISDVHSFMDSVERSAGHTVIVDLLRDGREIKKEVPIRSTR